MKIRKLTKNHVVLKIDLFQIFMPINGGGEKVDKPTVKLIGTDGNAFAILGKVRRVLEQNGYSEEQLEEFVLQATSGDYSNLLGVCTQWVNIT